MMDQPTHYTAKCAHCHREISTPIPIGVTGTFFCSGDNPCFTIWHTYNVPPVPAEPTTFEGDN